MAISYSEVEKLFASVRERYLLLLLTESSESVPKVKPGIPAIAYRVLDETTALSGPLDEALTNWSDQRPSSVLYKRLYLDREDTKTMVRLGVCWLPQIRLMKRETVLFRSSVSVGENGELLAQDVGGKSFQRRIDPSPQGFTNLLDALSAEIDRSRRPQQGIKNGSQEIKTTRENR